jgi:signal transduction histidine kinase
MDSEAINVLLIEDNPDDAFLIQETLADARGIMFHLEVVNRLSAGLERLAREGIDVVLLDLSLPDSKGSDTFKTMRHQFPNIPVVMMTGLDDEEMALEAAHEGTQDYLIKGEVDSNALSRSIRYAIERHRLLMETEHQRQCSQQLSQELQASITELRLTQQQVLQQERLRALGQMASGVAHDFNNALSPILGYSDLLLMQPDYLKDQYKTRELLLRIKTAAQTAGGVVTRLREFYRPRQDTEDFQLVDLNQVVEEAISLTQPKWQALAQAQDTSIKVEASLAQLPPVFGSEAQLRDLLINLIFNAVDAMPKGGTLTLRTQSDGSQVVLEVEDTGTGMTEEVRLRCLEPWFTTKGDKGTGLGLAMVYGITQRHAGVIDIRSKVGEGTTFTVRLPVQVATEGVIEAPATETRVRPLHVLVVDDEPQVREFLADYLGIDGHRVEAAADGREGLAKFLAGQFDLAVVDLAMPELSGGQLTAIFKQLTPDMLVISLSGFGELLEGSSSADLTLSKPVTVEELRRAVAKVMTATSKELSRA